MTQPIYAVRYGEPCPVCSGTIYTQEKRKNCARCNGHGYLWGTSPEPVSVLIWKDANAVESTNDYVLLAYRVNRQIMACNLAMKRSGIWRSPYGEPLTEPFKYAEVLFPPEFSEQVQP